MTQKRIFLTALFALVALAFTACKKDDVQPAYQYKTQGFVKGKLTGTSSDNAYTFNEDFNYTQYSLVSNTVSIYKINVGSTYSVQIERSDFNSNGSAQISFLLNNATDTAPKNIEIAFSYTKEFNDKFVDFNMESSVDNTSTITDLTFDAATGRAKGKFSITGADNSSKKAATVTGDFDVITKKVIE